jgi:hypothetical protein
MVSEIINKLWIEAKEALRMADVVVFMGYRFPPTYAEARGQLLDALRENTSPTG